MIFVHFSQMAAIQTVRHRYFHTFQSKIVLFNHIMFWNVWMDQKYDLLFENEFTFIIFNVTIHPPCVDDGQINSNRTDKHGPAQILVVRIR